MCKYIIFLFLLTICHSSSAQIPEDFQMLKNAGIAYHLAPSASGNQTREYFHSLSSDNKNEVELFFSGLFLFYKFFISSQDMMSCSFSPSCSEYSIMAIKKKPFPLGMLSAFDRLTRCHGLHTHEYPRDKETGLLLDIP